MIPLKECPFCGSKPHFSQSPIKGMYIYHIICEKCKLDAQYFGIETKPDKMAERWNRRYDEIRKGRG